MNQYICEFIPIVKYRKVLVILTSTYFFFVNDPQFSFTLTIYVAHKKYSTYIHIMSLLEKKRSKGKYNSCKYIFCNMQREFLNRLYDINSPVSTFEKLRFIAPEIKTMQYYYCSNLS